MDEHTDGENVEKKTFATAIPDNTAIPVGVAMGISFSIVFWLVFDNIGMGIAMGVVFGMIFGVGINAARKDEEESKRE